MIRLTGDKKSELGGWRGPGGCSILGGAPLDVAIPNWMTFTRGAGWYSNDLTVPPTIGFIAFGNVADTPRFHYQAATAKRMFVIEPTRTNEIPDSNFEDTAPADDIPDGWVLTSLGAGVNYDVIDANGPHTGAYFRLLAQRGVGESVGVQHNGIVLGALTQYIYSVYLRADGWPAGETIWTFALSPGIGQEGTNAGIYTWLRHDEDDTTVGAGAVCYMCSVDEWGATGTLHMACPQIEANSLYPSTWIPTVGGAGARAAELCAIDAARVNPAKGAIRFEWIPLYANDQVAGTHCLFAISAVDRIEFNGAADTIRIVNNGVNRATSAALAFLRNSYHVITAHYGPLGTTIDVDGVAVHDANAWVAPVASVPFLGSRAASANCESACYGNLQIWG